MQGRDVSLVLDWNFFIISAMETNGAVAGSRMYIFKCIMYVSAFQLCLDHEQNSYIDGLKYKPFGLLYEL